MAYVYVSNKTFLNFSVRKWRHKSTLGAQGQWQVEVGEPLTGPVTSCDLEVIKENCSNVGFRLCSVRLSTTSFSIGIFVYFSSLWFLRENTSKFHACKMDLNDLCFHSLCLHVKIQRPAFSGESATFPTPKMSLVSLWSHLRDASSSKPRTRSKDAWAHWFFSFLCCTLVACSPCVVPIDGTVYNTFVFTVAL